MASNGHVLCAGNWTKIDNCQPHFHARRWIFCFLSAGSSSYQALNANARARRVIFHMKRFPRGNQGWQRNYGRPDAEPPKANKIAPTFMPSTRAGKQLFLLRLPPAFFLTEKPWGRGWSKDALLRCDTHDMRRLLLRYILANRRGARGRHTLTYLARQSSACSVRLVALKQWNWTGNKNKQLVLQSCIK